MAKINLKIVFLFAIRRLGKDAIYVRVAKVNTQKLIIVGIKEKLTKGVISTGYIIKKGTGNLH